MGVQIGSTYYSQLTGRTINQDELARQINAISQADVAAQRAQKSPWTTTAPTVRGVNPQEEAINRRTAALPVESSHERFARLEEEARKNKPKLAAYEEKMKRQGFRTGQSEEEFNEERLRNLELQEQHRQLQQELYR